MTTSESCPFCDAAMSPERSSYLSGTRICDGCFAGGFVRALDGRGIRLQEMRHEWRRGSNVVDVIQIELVAALAYDLGLEATFAKEGLFSKLWKSRDEIQTGDAVFDKAVLIKTGSRELTAALLQSAALREAVADLIPLAFDALGIEGNRCRLSFGLGSATVPDPFEAKRALAVLFHHLELHARAKGLPRRPELLCIPDIGTVLRLDSGGRALEAVRFYSTTFDRLDELRALDGPFAKSQSAAIDLVDCTVLSGDFSPLAAIGHLRGLSLVGTELGDLASLATLGQLERLRLGEAQVTPDQLADLRARLPRVRISLGT